ncbi:hypothetical protein CPB85DRAFT_432155 [Mucidula mucida]|nr:hypothetical protein CPB85DRAFT_432155 [Mucidula mucida]
MLASGLYAIKYMIREDDPSLRSLYSERKSSGGITTRSPTSCETVLPEKDVFQRVFAAAREASPIIFRCDRIALILPSASGNRPRVSHVHFAERVNSCSVGGRLHLNSQRRKSHDNSLAMHTHAVKGFTGPHVAPRCSFV